MVALFLPENVSSLFSPVEETLVVLDHGRMQINFLILQDVDRVT